MDMQASWELCYSGAVQNMKYRRMRRRSGTKVARPARAMNGGRDLFSTVDGYHIPFV